MLDRTRRWIAAATLVVALLPAPLWAQSAPRAMVVSANPYATAAGLDVLRAGGDAVDAAIAVAVTLGLVEPQSSGLGGGGFMLRYDARTRTLTAFDGREVAPKDADPAQFLGADGRPLPFLTASRHGTAIGVPGLVAMLGEAHRRHGTLPWARTLEGTRHLAEDGFVVSRRLHTLLGRDPGLAQAPDLRAVYFTATGQPLGIGTTLRHPAYAKTLKRLQNGGPRALYRGPLARAIVRRAHDAPGRSTLSMADMADYQPHVHKALCRAYQRYQICVPPQPSGGVGLLQIMGILAHTDISTRSADDATAWHQFIEANRLMLADRAHYFADPDYVEDATPELLDSDYLRQRAAQIGTRAMTAPVAGDLRFGLAADPRFQATGTSHFVVVDADGDVVSVTQSVEYLFGSNRMAGGMVLNNQLTDFSFSPSDGALSVANRVEGGKRPRSSMAPVIVLDEHGQLMLALGSPGGAAIPSYIAKVLVAVLDWGMPLQQAINLGNIVPRGDGVMAELDRLPPTLTAALQAHGHALRPITTEDSGLHGAMLTTAHPQPGIDPRREGTAASF